MTTDIVTYTPEQVTLIKSIAAPKCTDDEFKLLLYQAQEYRLNPLLKQIWAVKYQDNKPASIFVGRDGLLTIALRSGVFDGMESGSRIEGVELIGWAKVYRKDMSHPFSIEVKAKEYNRNQSVWLTHPSAMIQKVAEAQALKRAFQISGIYTPEEMPDVEKPPMRDITPPDEKKKGGKPPVHMLKDGKEQTPIIEA